MNLFYNKNNCSLLCQDEFIYSVIKIISRKNLSIMWWKYFLYLIINQRVKHGLMMKSISWYFIPTEPDWNRFMYKFKNICNKHHIKVDLEILNII